jgi:hypothetical protein
MEKYIKMLLIGNLNSNFLFEYITEVLVEIPNLIIHVCAYDTKENTRPDIIDYCKTHNIYVFYPKKQKIVHFKRLPHPNIYLKSFFRLSICRKYDIINMHSIVTTAPAIALFASKDAWVIASYYGSDLLRAGKFQLYAQGFFLRRVNKITLATDYLIEMFHSLFKGKYDQQVVKSTYGSKNADEVIALNKLVDRVKCKHEFAFPTDKLLVYCGYNGYRAQRHIEIISCLSELDIEIKEKMYIVCHCSYGIDEHYINEIEVGIENSGIEGKVITKYISGNEMAKFRYCADIMLNLQQTDSFSASMQESMGAGAIVIKGDWLVYPEIERRNAFIFSIKNISELPTLLVDIIINFRDYREMSRKNLDLLYDMLSWEPKKELWKKIVLNKEI